MIRILTSQDGTARSYIPQTWEVKQLTSLLLGPNPGGVWYEIGDTTQYIDGCIEALAKEHGFKTVYETDPRTQPTRRAIDALGKLSDAEIDDMDKVAVIDASVESLFERSGYGMDNYRSINQ